jgi:predicted  nucleic acid-binding Zn-ribbon protein
VRQVAVQRKLQDLQSRVTALRAEIVVLSEQIEVIDEEVEDLRVRAVVSETPLAAKEHATAARHAALAHRAKLEAVENVARLERERDALLDQLAVEVAP